MNKDVSVTYYFAVSVISVFHMEMTMCKLFFLGKSDFITTILRMSMTHLKGITESLSFPCGRDI